MAAESADVCIIGAGLAGGLISHQLTKHGLRVVLLEAGRRHDIAQRASYTQKIVSGEADEDVAWTSEWPRRDVFRTVGNIGYPLNVLRAKGVGGSTLHWGGEALRFITNDFRMRSAYGVGDDWPITYDELEPYYVRAEHEMGVAGSNSNPFASPRSADFPLPAFPFSFGDKAIKPKLEEMGITMHHVPWARNSKPYGGRPACAAFATCGSYRVCPISAQFTSEGHIYQAEQTGHLDLVTDAHVRRLKTDRNNRITHALYSDSNFVEREVRAKVFVLASHCVETPRLLLLSENNAFPNGLANNSGLVGKRFMERPAISYAGRIADPIFNHRIGFHTAESHNYVDLSDRSQSAAFKLSFGTSGGATPAVIAAGSGKWGDALAKDIKATYGDSLAVTASFEQLPDERNSVSLDPVMRDVFGDPAPRIDLNYFDYETRGFARGERVCKEILQGLNVRNFQNSRNLGFAGHPMGTCRMGDDPASSVVDHNLRAHGISNLMLVGSSVFVTGSSLQPSLTIAALALRAADHIISQAKKPGAFRDA